MVHGVDIGPVSDAIHLVHDLQIAANQKSTSASLVDVGQKG